jgi:hypothetical protein
MKTHTSGFKNNIKKMGRVLDSQIIVGNTTYGKEDLNQITPRYEGAILKSVMKELEVDINEELEIGTELEYRLGVKVNNDFEYLSYGNYTVQKVEKQEDLNSYKITCYDKMIDAMVPYEAMDIEYPITIKNYLKAICRHLGWTFKNSTFANQSKEIQNELYLDSDGNDLGYTFRDVLDEIAQATASTICFDKDGKLEVRYITDTGDTIDEEFFKDTDVTVEGIYGPINSIVLTRAGGADSIYLRDEESIEENGLCEVKISENQIMNFNDRSTYLPDILEKLDGLQFAINDWQMTGVCYYELCDRYTASIKGTNYTCVMFNDEINVTQGLEEIINTPRPAEAVTDYTKADKTDRKINQTYIIVDKQNQVITSVVNQIGDRSEKQTTITQDIDGIASQVQDIPTITTEGHGTGSIFLENLANTKLVSLIIHPTTEDIIGLFASPLLKVRNGLTALSRGVTFDGNTDVYYKLPDNLYYYDENIYDEFIFNGKDEKVEVIHRVAVDEHGNKSILDPYVTEELEYQDIIIEGGNYNIFMESYPTAYINVKAMIKNDYTDLFATSYEVDSKIEQTADQILLQVNEKVDENEIIAKLNVAVQEGQGIIELTGNTVTIDSDYFKLDEDGKITATAGDIGGFMTDSKSFKKQLAGKYNYDMVDDTLALNYDLKWINYNNMPANRYVLDYNNDQSVDAIDRVAILNIINGTTQNTRNFTGEFEINSEDLKDCIKIVNAEGDKVVSLGLGGGEFACIKADYIMGGHIEESGMSYDNFVGYEISNDEIRIVSSTGAETIIGPGVITLKDADGNRKDITATN